MKKLFQFLLPVFIIYSQAFAIAGFGVSANQSLFSIDKNTVPLFPDTPSLGEFTHHGMNNGYGLGGYLYIDAIPFVDIDIEGNFVASTYNFSFGNPLMEASGTTIDNMQFAWISGSGYLTVKRKLLQFKIPVLAKAKLSAGVGINSHSSIPMIDLKMLKAVVPDGDLTKELDSDKLVDYLIENKISSTGFHIQTGLQFKVLMLDSFLYYRQVFADNVIPDAKGFGSLNLRLGMGF